MQLGLPQDASIDNELAKAAEETLRNATEAPKVLDAALAQLEAQHNGGRHPSYVEALLMRYQMYAADAAPGTPEFEAREGLLAKVRTCTTNHA